MIVQKIPVGCPIIISKFEKHDEIKNQLLSLIEKQNWTNTDFHPLDKVSRTDWYIDKGLQRDYWEFLFPIVQEHMKEVFAELRYDNFKIANYWFQQYCKNDNHGWHVHDESFWSSVYYVELPIDAPATMLEDPMDQDNKIVPDVYEGYILTFPAIIRHCSPVIDSDVRKTVIAFNVI